MGAEGFEPPTFCTSSRHSSQLSYASIENGVPWGIRTLDLLLRRQLLYPAELKARIGADDGNRTHVTSLEGWCSTIELHPQSSSVFSRSNMVTQLRRFVNIFLAKSSFSYDFFEKFFMKFVVFLFFCVCALSPCVWLHFKNDNSVIRNYVVAGV